MIPDLSPMARDVIEIITVACIVAASLYKIASLQAHTRRWNGLGRALRGEKWAYAAAWSWLVLKSYVPVLDSGVVFLALAVWLIVTEARTIRYIPRVRILHDRGGPTV